MSHNLNKKFQIYDNQANLAKVQWSKKILKHFIKNMCEFKSQEWYRMTKKRLSYMVPDIQNKEAMLCKAL